MSDELPDQPDGIDPYDHELPDAARATWRSRAYSGAAPTASIVALDELPKWEQELASAAERPPLDPPRPPEGDRVELIAIWQEYFEAKWMVSVASTREPNEAWSGWADVNADARRGVVDADGVEYTPSEARALAEAYRAAAQHAETFGRRVGALLYDLTSAGTFPEISHLPAAQQSEIRDALRAAGDRYRRVSGGTTGAS